MKQIDICIYVNILHWMGDVSEEVNNNLQDRGEGGRWETAQPSSIITYHDHRFMLRMHECVEENKTIIGKWMCWNYWNFAECCCCCCWMTK